MKTNEGLLVDENVRRAAKGLPPLLSILDLNVPPKPLPPPTAGRVALKLLQPYRGLRPGAEIEFFMASPVERGEAARLLDRGAAIVL